MYVCMYIYICVCVCVCVCVIDNGLKAYATASISEIKSPVKRII